MKNTLKIALCLIGMMISSNGHAETMGRLFFVPEQRAQMDYNFSRMAKPDDAGANALTLNGIVQRHGGKRTAWINGAPQIGSSDEKTPESMAVAIPGQNRSVKLKVGQRVLLTPTSPEPIKAEAAQ